MQTAFIGSTSAQRSVVHAPALPRKKTGLSASTSWPFVAVFDSVISSNIAKSAASRAAGHGAALHGGATGEASAAPHGNHGDNNSRSTK